MLSARVTAALVVQPSQKLPLSVCVWKEEDGRDEEDLVKP